MKQLFILAETASGLPQTGWEFAGLCAILVFLGFCCWCVVWLWK